MSELTVKSCYAAGDSTSEMRAFDDLRFSDDVYRIPSVGESILETLLRQFAIAKSHSRKAGRLFVSFLVTFVQGADANDFGERGRPADTLRRIILSADFERLFGSVVGIHAVYYTLLVRLSSATLGPPKRVFEAVKAYIASRPSLLKKMDLIPTAILPSSIREQCLAELSASLLHGPGDAALTNARIGTWLKGGMKADTIARKLQTEGMVNPRGFGRRGGRKWTTADVRWMIREFSLKADDDV